MSVAVTALADPATPFQGIAQTSSMEVVFFSLTFTGNYTTGGDALSLTIGDKVKSGRPPILVLMRSQKTGGVSGFKYEYTPGSPATQQNGKVQVMVAAGTEQVAGAYPAGVTGDTVVGVAFFPRI